MEYPTEEEVEAAASIMWMLNLDLVKYPPDRATLEMARCILNAAANLTQNPVTRTWLERDKRRWSAERLRAGERPS